MAAIMSRTPSLLSMRAAKCWACACTRSRTSAPILRPSGRWSRPGSMRRCCRANTIIPAIYVEVDGVYTNTAPVDAVRGAGRPEATFLVERIVEKAARETGHDPAEFRRKNFVDLVPASNAGGLCLRHRRLREGARQGAGARGLQGRSGAQGGLRRQGQAAWRGIFRLYRGMRPRSVSDGRGHGRRRRADGNRPRCG